MIAPLLSGIISVCCTAAVAREKHSRSLIVVNMTDNFSGPLGGRLSQQCLRAAERMHAFGGVACERGNKSNDRLLIFPGCTYVAEAASKRPALPSYERASLALAAARARADHRVPSSRDKPTDLLFPFTSIYYTRFRRYSTAAWWWVLVKVFGCCAMLILFASGVLRVGFACLL